MAAAVFADEAGEERDEEYEESGERDAAGTGGPVKAVPRAVAALLGACRRTLLALEQCNGSMSLADDCDAAERVTACRARLRASLATLAVQRGGFIEAVRRAAEQDDHRDAAILLMFFGET